PSVDDKGECIGLFKIKLIGIELKFGIFFEPFLRSIVFCKFRQTLPNFVHRSAKRRFRQKNREILARGQYVILLKNFRTRFGVKPNAEGFACPSAYRQRIYVTDQARDGAACDSVAEVG